MASFNKYPHVFAPFAIGRMELKNRLVFSPVVSGHATIREGEVTENLLDFIGACARTGVARVGIGATPVDFGRARDFFGCLSATRDTDIAGIRSLAEEVHRYDCKFSIELLHAGRIAQPEALAGRKAFVPWLAPDMNPEQVMQVGEEEMAEVITLFVNAVRRLAEAGVDEALIHGAHGNFLSGFLSPATNQRDDEYGGSFENRIRFPLRLLKAIRDEVGTSINLEFRISQNEYAENTISLEEVVAFLQQASAFIDSAHLSGGWIFDPNWIRKMMPSYTEPRNLNRERTALIHRELEIPVVTVGNITTMEMAEDILASDDADLVAMARSYLADPQFIKKAYRGQPELIRPCLRCIECAARPGYGGGVRCSVNPQCGRETKYGTLPPAETRKKVMVVGGGPAGMQAAQIAAKRGHDVTLYERESVLGGRLWEASALFQKEDTHRAYLHWSVAETERAGINIRLNCEVTPEFAAAEAPDVIINASGGVHIVPPIPGIKGEQVVSVTDADLERVPLGQRVVVMGGGISGLECAIQLSHKGHEVTLIDALPMEKLWREVVNELRSGLVEQMELHKVKLIDEALITALEPGCLRYTRTAGTMGADASAQTQFPSPGGVAQSAEVVATSGAETGVIEADSFVASFGIARDTAFNQALREVIPEVYVVGDAREPHNIFWANMDGFNVAVEL